MRETEEYTVLGSILHPGTRMSCKAGGLRGRRAEVAGGNRIRRCVGRMQHKEATRTGRGVDVRYYYLSPSR